MRKADNMLNETINVSDKKSNINRMFKNKFKVEVVSRANPSRKKVEHFIWASYKRHFSAELHSFFPLILSFVRIKDNTLVGAVGLRYADESRLFSECYLPEGIEHLISAEENIVLNRNKIIELGNFVVRKRSDLLDVVPLIGKFIKSLQVDWVVYTLTQVIKDHFHAIGIDLCFLADAKIEAVNGAAMYWGKYYEFKPAVFYTNIKSNMNQT